MSRWKGETQRWILLLAILGALMALKVSFSPGVWWGRDGIYFLQVARHVSDGEGIVSNTSLYHQGFKSFPHRVNQSPIWPALLGYSGRWFGLEPTGEGLPELLYLVDLIPATVAFATAAAVSLLLVCGYLWRAHGKSLARVALLAQFAYMVLFSASFFFDGLTGITITIGAIVTLAILMMVTARVAARPSPRTTQYPESRWTSAPPARAARLPSALP